MGETGLICQQAGTDAEILLQDSMTLTRADGAAGLSHSAGKNGQKKARYGSGLNLSLEENRGDSFIMLHRKKEIQFNFLMSAIGFINDTAESVSNRDALGAQKKMFYDSKMFKDAQLSITFLRIVRPAGGRRALPWSTLPGYHGYQGRRPCTAVSISTSRRPACGPHAGRIACGRSARRSLPPFPAWGLPSGRCTVT
jgi:hypothetical protein